MDSVIEILHQIKGKLEEHDQTLHQIKGKLEEHDQRFDRIDGRLDKVESDAEKLNVFLVGEFNVVYERFEKLDTGFEDLSTRMTRVEVLLEDQRDDIKALAEGFSTHDRRLNNHESRILKLEKSA